MTPKRPSFILPFFLATFGWSWTFWVPAALWGDKAPTFLVPLFFGLGGLGPMIFGILFTYREGKGDYWKRVLDWRRMGWKGWCLSLLAVPFLTCLAGGLDRLLGGAGLDWDDKTLQLFAGTLPLPLALLTFLGFLLCFGPIPEELGWRGYALDRLRAHWGTFKGSLLLGLLWGLWHLPLFFMKGAYQQTLGVGTLGFFLFFAAIVPLAVIMTWIYDLTGRSILSAILFHFSVNATGTVAAHGNGVELWRVLFCWAWALAVPLPRKGRG